jgi:hypothetical protein
MWARNLFFLGVVGAGLTALTAGLFPAKLPSRLKHADTTEVQHPDFRKAVARVDTAFQKQWQEHQIEPAPRAPGSQC